MAGRLELLRVLVVDGDRAGDVAGCLSRAGAIVAVARTPAEAVGHAAAGDGFDALVCRLADVEGDRAVYRTLRAPRDAARPTPAIAVVAELRTDLEADRDFDAHVADPLDEALLVALVARLTADASAEPAAEPAGPLAATNGIVTEVVPASLSVLVIDDTKVVADVLAQLFDVLGHRATVVNSGREAIALLSRTADVFDVIFSDISMPDMDGHELAGHIRSLRDSGDVRTRLLVAMSGYGDPEEKARSLRSGFDRHVVKPPDVTDLENLLAEASALPA